VIFGSPFIRSRFGTTGGCSDAGQGSRTVSGSSRAGDALHFVPNDVRRCFTRRACWRRSSSPGLEGIMSTDPYKGAAPENLGHRGSVAYEQSTGGQCVGGDRRGCDEVVRLRCPVGRHHVGRFTHTIIGDEPMKKIQRLISTDWLDTGGLSSTATSATAKAAQDRKGA